MQFYSHWPKFIFYSTFKNCKPIWVLGSEDSILKSSNLLKLPNFWNLFNFKEWNFHLDYFERSKISIFVIFRLSKLFKRGHLHVHMSLYMKQEFFLMNLKIQHGNLLRYLCLCISWILHPWILLQKVFCKSILKRKIIALIQNVSVCQSVIEKVHQK